MKWLHDDKTTNRGQHRNLVLAFEELLHNHVQLSHTCANPDQSKATTGYTSLTSVPFTFLQKAPTVTSDSTRFQCCYVPSYLAQCSSSQARGKAWTRCRKLPAEGDGSPTAPPPRPPCWKRDNLRGKKTESKMVRAVT